MEGTGVIQQSDLPGRSKTSPLSGDAPNEQAVLEEERDQQSGTKPAEPDIRFSKEAVRVFAWCTSGLMISAVFGMYELVSTTVENWESYDTVFIGYPI